MRFVRARSALTACLVLVASCGGGVDDPESGSAPAGGGTDQEPVAARCELPSAPDTVREDGDAVLLVWEFADAPVFHDSVLPPDSAFLSYRAALRADSADLRRPIADPPDTTAPGMAEVWRNEGINHELAQGGEVGAIEPIVCLDALFFAYQNARVSQLAQPTEFLLSVLRREVSGRTELAAVFGAGAEMFPPKSVYGFDVVDEYMTAGWSYWYALHNHTLQRNEGRIALGNPTLSTSDVQLTRGLVSDRGLANARVTNGIYTYSVPAEELGPFRSR